MKSADAGATWTLFSTPGTGTSHITSINDRFFYSATNVYYSTDNGVTFPLSYTYPGTGGAMWGIGSNITGAHLTVFFGSTQL